MINEHDYRSYWNQNIERWGDFYLDISHGHETLNAPPWLAAMYRATVGRLERRLMAERYARTVALLDRFVRPGITLSDLGCGTGIFVVEALKRGRGQCHRLCADCHRHHARKCCNDTPPRARSTIR